MHEFQYDSDASYEVQAPGEAPIGRLVAGRYYDYRHMRDNKLGPMNAHLEGDRLIKDDLPDAGGEIGSLVGGQLVHSSGKPFDLIPFQD